MVYGVARTTEEISPGGSDQPLGMADHREGHHHSESDTRDAMDAGVSLGAAMQACRGPVLIDGPELVDSHYPGNGKSLCQARDFPGPEPPGMKRH